MGINRLLIDSRIQDFWYGHTKTGPDRRWDREEGAWHAAGPGTPAYSGMCSGLMTVAAVSALVERVGWSLQWLYGWSIHSIDVDRYSDANVTVDDWQASWLSQGVQKSIVMT